MTDKNVRGIEYRVRFGEDDMPEMRVAEHVGVNGSWQKYRDPATGEEWNEQGRRWHPSRTAALKDFVRTCFSLWNGGFPLLRDRSPDKCFRAGVKAAAMLWFQRRKERGLPPAPANVYADWLDENGFPAAGAALREAFPLRVHDEGR